MVVQIIKEWLLDELSLVKIKLDNYWSDIFVFLIVKSKLFISTSSFRCLVYSS